MSFHVTQPAKLPNCEHRQSIAQLEQCGCHTGRRCSVRAGTLSCCRGHATRGERHCAGVAPLARHSCHRLPPRPTGCHAPNGGLPGPIARYGRHFDGVERYIVALSCKETSERSINTRRACHAVGRTQLHRHTRQDEQLSPASWSSFPTSSEPPPRMVSAVKASAPGSESQMVPRATFAPRSAISSSITLHETAYQGSITLHLA
jgi:hypothetical protein